MNKEKYYCEVCESEVTSDSEFCVNCGSLFAEDISCINHQDTDAEGVCIICAQPFCERCASMIDDLFLCYEHERYEIIQNHARIKGSSIESELRFYKNCLEKEGLHPVIFNRKVSPLHLGGTDYTLFRASGEHNGHIINEIKLMVPCHEVLEAERILDEVDAMETGNENSEMNE